MLNHYQNNIQILQDKGQKITSDIQQQLHSRVVTFDCGCKVNSEFCMGQSRMVQNPRYKIGDLRMWLCPCSKHTSDQDFQELEKSN